MAEINFEKLALALEATRGTAVTPPTHVFPLTGTLDPMDSRYKPDERSRGFLAGRTRSKVVRRWTEWSAEGGLDTFIMPVMAEMGLDAGVSPTQPDAANAPNTHLWEYVRAMLDNTLKTATLYFGDPNVQTFQSPFGLLQEIVITADATGEDGATLSVTGMAQKEAKIAAPTYPSQVFDSLIVPADMQVWLDTSSAIGTTELTGRALRVQHTIPIGLRAKFLPQGPGGDRTFTRAGVARTVPTTTVAFELIDTAQYDLFNDEDRVKLRVRHNGAFIEDDGAGTDYYEYVEVDGYGYLESPAWGEFEETNRTIEFTLEHEYESDIASDIRVAIQNQRSSL